MSPDLYISYKELKPEDCTQRKQCYICDLFFRTKRDLKRHQQAFHSKVVIFEIVRDEKKRFEYFNSWKVSNFDDLFLDRTDQIKQNSIPSTRKKRISKPKHKVKDNTHRHFGGKLIKEIHQMEDLSLGS